MLINVKAETWRIYLAVFEALIRFALLISPSLGSAGVCSLSSSIPLSYLRNQVMSRYMSRCLKQMIATRESVNVKGLRDSQAEYAMVSPSLTVDRRRR